MKGMKRRAKIAPYCFIAPFFIIFSYFYFVPVFKVIMDSFTDYDMFTKRNFVGLKNYMELMKDEIFIISVGNTFFYTVCMLFPALIIGLLLACLIGSSLVKTKYTRMAIFIPHVISMVAISMIWLYIYEPGSGVLNQMLRNLHMRERKWLFEPQIALLCLAVMGIWKSVGYYMVVFLSGLKGISRQYYEAAQIDGSGPVNTFFHITLPLLKPTTTFLLITGIISSFNVFEQVNIMTKGGPLNRTTTMVHQIYIAGFTEYKLGYASAMSVVLLLIVIGISALNFGLAGKE